MEDITIKVRELFAVFGVRIIAAIVILIVGWWIAKVVRNGLRKVLTIRAVDPLLVSFAGHLAYALIMVFVILAALGKLGVQTTSFVAIVGAAGLAVGLALQGALANFAAGVLMLVFRPFKVGDYVEGGGAAGVVEEIQIFTTKLKTPDNKLLIVPNAKMTGDNITNYSAKETRRVDFVFGVSYGDDIEKVNNVIEDVLSKDERVLKDPAPTIGLLELGDSSVNFAVRPWVKTADYWNVYFSINEAMKKRFDEEGVSIPFPQRDVHMYQHKEGE
jgi:small conductance mechanosensitive channel